MDAHDDFEYPSLGQDLALHMRPRPDHVPVVRARQPSIVEEGGNANVNLNLEIGAAVVPDEMDKT